MKIILSATRRANPISWVTTIIVMPVCASSAITSNTSDIISGSSAEVGSSNAWFVTDDIVERFGPLGSVEDHVKKLLELRDAGVDQFNLYLMNGDEPEQLELFGNKVIPAYKAAAAATSR